MKIIILPGLDGTGFLVTDVAQILAQRHDVTCLHFPVYLSQYEDLRVWIEAQLPANDYILVAESFSGPLAVMIAARRPRHLIGIVFVATFARKPRNIPAIISPLIRILPIKTRVLTWLMQPFVMGRWSNAKFTAKFQQAIRAVPTSTFANRLRAVLTVDVTPNLSDLDLPFTYMRPSNDRLVPAKSASDFRRLGRNATTIQGPHFLLQANPAQSAKHILDFVSSVLK